ncbi:GTPase-activating Rap/Ran-GAP domain-like protein 3 [Balamuthia mandrillaris]
MRVGFAPIVSTATSASGEGLRGAAQTEEQELAQCLAARNEMVSLLEEVFEIRTSYSSFMHGGGAAAAWGASSGLDSSSVVASTASPRGWRKSEQMYHLHKMSFSELLQLDGEKLKSTGSSIILEHKETGEVLAYEEITEMEEKLVELFGENLEEFDSAFSPSTNKEEKEKKGYRAATSLKLKGLVKDRSLTSAAASSSSGVSSLSLVDAAQKREARMKLCKAFGKSFEDLSESLRSQEALFQYLESNNNNNTNNNRGSRSPSPLPSPLPSPSSAATASSASAGEGGGPVLGASLSFKTLSTSSPVSTTAASPPSPVSPSASPNPTTDSAHSPALSSSPSTHHTSAAAAAARLKKTTTMPLPLSFSEEPSSLEKLKATGSGEAVAITTTAAPTGSRSMGHRRAASLGSENTAAVVRKGSAPPSSVSTNTNVAFAKHYLHPQSRSSQSAGGGLLARARVSHTQQQVVDTHSPSPLASSSPSQTLRDNPSTSQPSSDSIRKRSKSDEDTLPEVDPLLIGGQLPPHVHKELKNLTKFHLLFGEKALFELRDILDDLNIEEESIEKKKQKNKEKLGQFLLRRPAPSDLKMGGILPQDASAQQHSDSSTATSSDTLRKLKMFKRARHSKRHAKTKDDSIGRYYDDPMVFIGEGLNEGSPSIKPRYINDPKDYNWDASNPPLLIPSIGFRLELGTPMDETTKEEVLNNLYLEYPEQDICFYHLNFIGKEHANYLGHDAKLGPVAISMEDAKFKDKEDVVKVLIRTKRGEERVLVPVKSSSKETLKALRTQVPNLANAKLVKVKDPQLIQDLVELELKLLSRNYKFGILYVTEGQDDENAMFANQGGSDAFREFLQFLGTEIKLQGWDGFRGGLDVKKNSTGTHSVHTKFREFEIMFHVSTMLPYNPDDEQQLERKRHLGNDIVVIIFVDGTTPFPPDIIKSEFNHTFIVVQVAEQGDSNKPTKYKISCGDKTGVRPYGPYLPDPPIFPKGDKFLEFFLTKLLNAERAALHAPDFRDKIQRTRLLLLKDIVEKYCKKKDLGIAD